MSTERSIQAQIETAATTVGSLWPLHSFVTANPLAGFEAQPFAEAVQQAGDLLGGRGYPSAATFRTALDRGQIDSDRLAAALAAAGYEADPGELLDRIAGSEADADDTAAPAAERVDRVLCKWLSAFLEEGSADWSMPNRDAGFYAAFREVAAYDSDLPDAGVLADLPETPTEAITTALAPYPEEQWLPVFEEQLAALPGWTGFIKRRSEAGSAWQSTAPITLTEYLAVRLALLDGFGVDIEPSTGPDSAEADATDDLAEAFLSAWEATYRAELVEQVAARSRALAERDAPGRPDAQLVFCIDTRSEIIRRHVEAAGAYETYGYAGFFGIPMEYRGYDDDLSTAAHPPILEAEHHVAEIPTGGDTQARHDRWTSLGRAAGEIAATLKSNAATAYGYVETAGSGYGLALAARTLVPERLHGLLDGVDESVPASHEFCEQTVDYQHSYVGDLPVGLTLREKVEYAETAFELMGWAEFARLVVFAGHASETTNNPYAASLDCGACAGNPGGPSARVLAAVCNDPAVRAKLRERGIDIPDDTVFLAGQHNTTTDEIELYDDHVPESHATDLARLRSDLETARADAAAERVADMNGDSESGVRETARRAADWAETRPEWGLAGNAAFVVGPRALTESLDLDGRSFLHSYEWSSDPDGEALEAIMTGPMVVTQWINAQYYFSTVDNAVYGSGSKVTQNPVGNIGVHQGNGGDLMTGLPLQSLMAAADEPYHQPLRLSTVVHAPVERVTDVLADHETLAELLDNDWLSLTVVDPTQEHRAFHYDRNLEWTAATTAPEASTVSPEPTLADD